MVLGFQNGSVRSYALPDKSDMGLLGPYGTRWVHNQDYGDISSLAYSHDDNFIFSAGLDGNFFVMWTPDAYRYAFGKKAKQATTIPINVEVSRGLPRLSDQGWQC